MSKRSLPVIILVALLALVAGSCSSAPADESIDAGSTDGAPATLAFSETLTAAAAANSARFEGRYTITGVDGATSGDSDPASAVELAMSGSFDIEAEAMEMTIDLGDFLASGLVGDGFGIPPGFEGFLSEPMKIVVIGTEGWLNWSVLSLFTGQEDAWMALGADEIGTATEDFGLTGGAANPTEVLAALAGADAAVEDLGLETVRDVQTRHWRALVDLASVSAELDPIERAALEAKVGPLTTTEFPLELWVAVDDGLLRRYSIEVPGEAIAADAPSSVGAVELVVDIYDYGTDVGIIAPPPDQVVSGEGLLMP